jgi:hypothetical protein
MARQPRSSLLAVVFLAAIALCYSQDITVESVDRKVRRSENRCTAAIDQLFASLVLTTVSWLRSLGADHIVVANR